MNVRKMPSARLKERRSPNRRGSWHAHGRSNCASQGLNMSTAIQEIAAPWGNLLRRIFRRVFHKERRSPNRRSSWHVHGRGNCASHGLHMSTAIQEIAAPWGNLLRKISRRLFHKERRSPNRRSSWHAHERSNCASQGLHMSTAIQEIAAPWGGHFARRPSGSHGKRMSTGHGHFKG